MTWPIDPGLGFSRGLQGLTIIIRCLNVSQSLKFIDKYSGLDDFDQPLKKLTEFHDFRPDNTSKEISKDKFRICNYKTPVARREQALKEASILLSSGETGCYRKPFIFRAHDPL